MKNKTFCEKLDVNKNLQNDIDLTNISKVEAEIIKAKALVYLADSIKKASSNLKIHINLTQLN